VRPSAWLRTASVLTLLHAITHTIGGVYGKPAPGPQETAVAVMKNNVFPVMGNTRSLWDFYHGMGLAVAVFLTVEALVFWLLANAIQKNDCDLRDVLAAFLIGYLALAVVSVRYFFLPPVVVELLIAACLVMAILATQRTAAKAV